jgi:3-oxoacyl-[acyl-carrier-protein] synthase I
MNSPVAYIAGVGMITSIGFNTAMTSASVRAGICQFSESGYCNKAMKPIVMAPVPDDALPELDPFIRNTMKPGHRDTRILQMAHVAIAEALENVTVSSPLPVLFSGPEIYPNTSYARMPRLLEALGEQTGLDFDGRFSRSFNTGRAGVFEALDLAFRCLFEAGLPAVLVGGSDSYQRSEILIELDRDDRIKVEEAMDFFVPGEAAGFLLLTRDANAALDIGGYRPALCAPGTALETGHRYSDQPLRGDGLAHAFRTALEGFGKGSVKLIYSSMNGERLWAREYGVAVTRTRDYFHDDAETIHPADCFGDLGGATGAVLIGLAAHQASGRTTPALIYGSSDQGYCGAVCLVAESAHGTFAGDTSRD